MTTDTTSVSPLKRREIVDALRNGAVPRRGLELFAMGLEPFEKAIDAELAAVAAGGGRFKAVRGEYGSGKTFFARWLEHRARQLGFATALVQISENTPLYRMETVYRRAVESLQTKEWSEGAFRSLVERWFYALEEEVGTSGNVSSSDDAAVAAAVGELLEKRLAAVSATQPQFAAALRRCHAAQIRGEHAVVDGLVAWLMGQPNVGASVKREAGIKGDIDHRGAHGFLRGLLELLRQTGRKGLVLVLDEVETIQRVRADSREKSLNALRQFIDDLFAGQFPGLYILVTGTPLFFDGPQGVKRLEALAQRVHTEFGKEPRFDNPRAVQIRLSPFDLPKLVEVGRRVRDLYPAEAPDRIRAKVSDTVLERLAEGISGKLGGKLGLAPRLYLRRVVDLLDRVDTYPDFEPTEHYELVVDATEMTDEERAAAGVGRSVDDIALDVGKSTDEGIE